MSEFRVSVRLVAKGLRIPLKIVLQWINERSVPSFGSGHDATIPLDALVQHLRIYEKLSFPWFDEDSPWEWIRFRPVLIVKPLCVQRALGAGIKGALTSRFAESRLFGLDDAQGLYAAAQECTPSGIILHPGHSIGSGMKGCEIMRRFSNVPILVLGRYGGTFPGNVDQCQLPSTPDAIVEAFASFARAHREASVSV